VGIKSTLTHTCECDEIRCKRVYKGRPGATLEEVQKAAEVYGWSFDNEYKVTRCPHHAIEHALDEDPNAELRVMCPAGHGLMYMAARDIQGVETYKCTGCPEEKRVKVSGGWSNLWPRKTA